VLTHDHEHPAHDRRFAAAIDLGAAKRCFARNGFAGTTTKSVAACGLDFRGAAVQALPDEIGTVCRDSRRRVRADPAMHWLLGLEPSTETLVVLMRAIVHHFLHVIGCARSGGGQRLRLMISSELDDGRIRAADLRKDRGLVLIRFSSRRWSGRWRRETRPGLEASR